MNVDLPTLLASRADAVEPPRVDPLAVVTRGEHLVRRRRGLAAFGAALAVTLTIGVTAVVLDGRGEQTSPARPSDPTVTTEEGARPLSYGQGQVLHLGGRRIDTGLDFLSLDVTDEGAALTTLDGGIWFTNGTEVEQVGTTLGGRAVRDGVTWAGQRPRDWVVNDSSGSLLAWLEFPGGDKRTAELVVYDSASGVEVARQSFEAGGNRNRPAVAALAGRQVFVTAPGVTTFPNDYLRYDVDTGVLEPADVADLGAALRSVPRVLVIGSDAESADVLGARGPVAPQDDFHRFAVTDLRITDLVDPRSGAPIELEVPEGYEGVEMWFLQWLDDDRFTLIEGTIPRGDLLVCQVSATRCSLAIDRSEWTSEPLIPGHGGVGAEMAMITAIEEVRER